MSILLALLALGFLIFIHELGHFLCAKYTGVTVEEFAVGFPPRVAKKEYRGTLYSLGMIPVGGFVKLRGQGIEDENPNEKNNYASKSISARLLIIIGGPLANLIFAFMVMPLVFMVGETRPAYLSEPALIGSVEAGSPADRLGILPNDQISAVEGINTADWEAVLDELSQRVTGSGFIELTAVRNRQPIPMRIAVDDLKAGIGWNPLIQPVIGQVMADSPAEAAGLQPGDRIVKINDRSVSSWTDLVDALQVGEENVSLTYERQGRLDSVDLKATVEPETNRKIIGIGIATETKKYTFFEAVSLGTARNLDLIMQTVGFIKGLFASEVAVKDLGGPVMITNIMGSTLNQSPVHFLSLLCFISLQLALLNLLPFPVLDGGHIVFLLLEKITRRPLSVKFRQITNTFGFVVLVSLMLFITAKDTLTLLGN